MTDHSIPLQSAPIPSALEQGLRLIGASPAPMFIVRGGGMIAANPAFAALLEGAPAASPDNWAPLASLLPGAGELAARILDGSLAQARIEVELHTRVQLALSPVCEPDGAIVGVLGVAAPLPPQVDQAARELDRLVELSPVGVVRYTLDGDILDCNNAFLAMLGLDRDDLSAGLSWRALTPPEWREADDAGIARLRAHDVMPLIEKEFLHRDGRRIPVLVGAGNLLADRRQGFGVVIDISATRAAERALAESEARFRAITNAMPQMVWSTLPDGFHDYYNDQWYAFTGVPAGSTDGEGWNGMFHPDDQEAAWAKWRHSLATGEPYEIEYRLRHHSGTYRWVLGRALPVRDAQGGIQRWMGTCTDIHEHKLTEDALREADQRKDEFLAMLGHELRNPLAPIRSAAALLPLAKADPARVEHIGRVIARQSTHMTGLIDDLLDVSRVTRGLIALGQEDVAVRLLVDEAIEQARPLVEAREHALSVVDQAAGIQVHGDRKRLVQVLANLLSNAAKYTPPGGRIVVTLARAGNMVEIAVSDNGIGMAPELVDSVFELFRQGQRTPDRAQGGLGIGLALVKKLVLLHGGRVRASSPGEGLGSEVVVALPA
ncbi:MULTISPECIES: sensor histidine kinase [Massilia]|uniref:sensor histidine kinase n=1 Tax=Massilia TaxID=149698 RepID=UPI000F2DE73B|nr:MULTISPECIES: PAS domain-containing sensor histidine kinase [Massilia]MDY0960942.1 PAS domain-containing sensor histidine kinase [Massilia sp. CFBP9026]